MSGIAYIKSGAEANSFGSASSLAPSLASVAAGNAVVLELHWARDSNTAPPGTPSGWTLMHAPTGIACTGNASYKTGVAWYCKLNSSGGTETATFTVDGSSANTAVIHEFTGVLTASAVDTPAIKLTSGTGSLTTGSVGPASSATATANEVVLIAISMAALSSTTSTGIGGAPTLYTALETHQNATNGVPGASAYHVLAASGTPAAAAWTWTHAGEYIASMIALKGNAPTPPVLSSPVPPGGSSSVGSVTAVVGATTDTGTGTLYSVVSTASLAGITGTQIRAGQNAAGAASPNASVAVTSAGALTTPAETGLTVSTAYNYALVHNTPADGDSNIVFGSFTTFPASPVISSISGTLAPGQTLTINGSGFGTTQSTSTVTLLGTSLTVLSWSSGVITAAVALGTNLYGVAGTLVVIGATNGPSNSFPIPGGIVPASGSQYVNLGAQDATTSTQVPLEGSPTALASGMQIMWNNVQGVGTATVFGNGEYRRSAGVTSFDYAVGTPGSGYGAPATITFTTSVPAQPEVIWIT